MRTMVAVVTAALLWATVSARAEDAAGLAPTRIQIDARVANDIDNDSMRATLFAEAEESDAARAADRVNRAARETVDALKRFGELRVSTGNYNTYPVTEKGRIVRWRARAQVVVEGRDFALMSSALGSVQSRMQLAGVEFYVSQQRRDEVEAELTQSAIAAFLAKAGHVAKAFHGSGFRVAEAAVSSEAAYPSPRPVMMKSMAAEAAPVFEGGTSRVGISVSGTILVLP